MKYNFVAIEGNIGAGKTTLSTMLAEYFNARLVLAQFADNPFLPEFYKQPEKVAFPLELSFLADRYAQLKSDLVNLNLFSNITIADYFIFKSKIFASNNLKEDELFLYHRLFDIIAASLPKPDLLIYLRSSIPNLVSQIHKRGRDYENSISIDYLSRLNERYEAWIQTYNKGKLVIIDVDNIDFVNNPEDLGMIINRIDAELNGLF